MIQTIVPLTTVIPASVKTYVETALTQLVLKTVESLFARAVTNSTALIVPPPATCSPNEKFRILQPFTNPNWQQQWDYFATGQTALPLSTGEKILNQKSFLTENDLREAAESFRKQAEKASVIDRPLFENHARSFFDKLLAPRTLGSTRPEFCFDEAIKQRNFFRYREAHACQEAALSLASDPKTRIKYLLAGIRALELTNEHLVSGPLTQWDDTHITIDSLPQSDVCLPQRASREALEREHHRFRLGLDLWKHAAEIFQSISPHEIFSFSHFRLETLSFQNSDWLWSPRRAAALCYQNMAQLASGRILLPFQDPAVIAKIEQERLGHFKMSILLLKEELLGTTFIQTQQKELQKTLTDTCLNRAYFAHNAQHLKLKKAEIAAIDAEAYNQAMKAAEDAKADGDEALKQGLSPLEDDVRQVHYLRMAATYAITPKTRLAALEQAYDISDYISVLITKIDQEKHRIIDVSWLEHAIELAQQEVAEESSCTNWLSIFMPHGGAV